MRSLKQIDLAYNDIDGASLLNFLNNMSDEMLHNLETLFIRYDDRGERGRRIRSYSSDEEVRYDDAADTGRRINSNVSDAEVEMFQEAILERLAKYYNDVATDTLLLVIDILPPQFRNLNRKEIMDAYRAYEQGPGGLMGGKSRSRKSKKRCKRRKRRTKKL
jgi:hypothetical protein